MVIDVNNIKDTFLEYGFALTRETVKLLEFQSPKTAQYIYFYKDRDHSTSIQLLVHPSLDIQPYRSLEDVTCQKPDQYRHGSNMSQFPKRRHRGENEIHFARSLEVSSLEGLGRFLLFFDTPAGNQREGSDLPPRLTAIELKNFKGFGEFKLPDESVTGTRIDLAPITLLFGANSAGKSTILQAMQYVREVLERRNTNPDRTLYGGDFVDLGGFRNLVHQRDYKKRSISIKLDLELNRASLPDLVPEPWEDLQASQPFNENGIWEFHELIQETKSRVESVSVQIDVGWSAVRQTAVVVGYEAGVNGEWLARITSSEDGRDVSIRLNKDNPIFMRYYTQGEIEMLDDLEGWVDPRDLEAAPESGEVAVVNMSTSTLNDIDDKHAYSILSQILARVRDAGMERPGEGLRRWLTGFDSALPRLGELLDIPVSTSGGSAEIYIAREFTAFISSLVVGPGVLIRDQLRKLRYLGPIRIVPERYFDAALTPDEARWADGTSAWETLLTGDDELIESVSKWMSDESKLATGYEIERRIYSEIDTSTLDLLVRMADGEAFAASMTKELKDLPQKRKLQLIEHRSGLPVQPRDVGIGISQVLPVVVAALEPSALLVAIEQPELHIHPAVQVGLGDLLIKGAKELGISFLIETHSEHLMLRLLRRVRETAENELPAGLALVTPEDINVLYIGRNNDGVKVTSLPIDETGEFIVPWPKGFFGERAEELF